MPVERYEIRTRGIAPYSALAADVLNEQNVYYIRPLCQPLNRHTLLVRVTHDGRIRRNIRPFVSPSTSTDEVSLLYQETSTYKYIIHSINSIIHSLYCAQGRIRTYVPEGDGLQSPVVDHLTTYAICL